jgi:hypothetical protein
VPPTLPTLLKILTGATESSDFNATENTNIINTKGSVIEINITGLPGHPFHLHGHSFDVVQSAGGSRNLVNPPRRDVVVTAGNPADTDYPARGANGKRRSHPSHYSLHRRQPRPLVPPLPHWLVSFSCPILVRKLTLSEICTSRPVSRPFSWKLLPTS